MQELDYTGDGKGEVNQGTVKQLRDQQQQEATTAQGRRKTGRRWALQGQAPKSLEENWATAGGARVTRQTQLLPEMAPKAEKGGRNSALPPTPTHSPIYCQRLSQVTPGQQPLTQHPRKYSLQGQLPAMQSRGEAEEQA